MNKTSSIDDLVRPEVRYMQAYQSTDPAIDAIMLHANEAPADSTCGQNENLNRYPANRPRKLISRMAAFYGVAEENLLVTRGSSEGIDLVLRTFCAANRDNVLLTPPTFEMYQVYATLQGARTINVSRDRSDGFTLDIDAVIAACDDRTKVMFLCSPNNPNGSLLPLENIQRLLDARNSRTIVVVDEAYTEFSGASSLAPLVVEYENLVVLRTLSKAFGLAGARCGAVVASSRLVNHLSRVMPPYAISSLVIESATNALSKTGIEVMRNSVSKTIAERDRVQKALRGCAAVSRTWASAANFLLVEFADLAKTISALESRNIMIRSYGDDSDLESCARITIASPAENDQLIGAIREID